ncbi:MAG: phosphodiester glycosidase family protein [Kiritimatiellae bacterium]|nr:phosphodiester glycosidase family protein [Kiritimatiellia bacterium]
MKKFIFSAVVVLTVIAAAASTAGTENAKVKRISPDVLKHFPAELREKPMRSASAEKLADGVMYLSAHFDNLFGDGPVATHWLLIDWKKAKGISLNIARRDERRECPSVLAKENKALACVNGVYHSTVDPSIPYFQLKVDGKMIPSKYPNGEATLAFNAGGEPVIRRFGKDLLEKYDNVMSCDGVPGYGKPLPDYSDKSPKARKKRAACRAPRTFAGNDTANRITVIGIADGRQKHSIGVNYVELRYLLEKFGCDPKALISMDGGGSTMMGLRHGDDITIVNKPSDGRERRVAESLQILDSKSKK